MWPNDCTQCMDPSVPTKDDWQKMLPSINHYYYEQGLNLQHLGQKLCEEYGFHAKERQYKSRFKQTEHHSKRLRSEHYLAMHTVAQAYPPQTVYFKAWRGGRRVHVFPQQISKELGRSQRRDDSSSPSRPRTLSPAAAQRVLRESDIHFHFVNQSESQALLSHSPSAFSAHSPIADDSDVAMMSSTRNSPLSDERSMTTISLTPELPTTSLELPFRTSNWANGLQANSIERQQLSLAGMAVSAIHSPSSESYFDHCSLSWAFNIIDAGPQSSVSAAFNADDQLPYTGGLPRPQAPIDAFQRMAGGWVYPHIEDSFGTQTDSSPDRAMCKRRGSEKLDFMLKMDPTNRYILPYLNFMVIVLGSNCKYDKLHEFLRESCEVIDQLPRPTVHLACPFRYALAYSKGDTVEMRYYGTMFEATQHHLEVNCGPNHPNVIVNSYYWAWHLLEEHQYPTVIQMLEEMLPRARKNMGSHNLVIVNCLAILARAYSEVDASHHDLAQKLLAEALQLLEDVRHTLAYRLTLMVRLAQTQARLGDFRAAEDGLKKVISQRAKLFGYKSPRTWAAIQELWNLLNLSGRKDDAHDAWKFHEEGWNREQRRQWYVHKQYDVPAELADSPSVSRHSRSNSADVRPSCL